jgi:hypothetical protein
MASRLESIAVLHALMPHRVALIICVHIMQSWQPCFQVEEEVAETLILMEYADLGSLDHYAARTSFKGNLVRPPYPNALSSPLCFCQLSEPRPS